MSVLDAYANHQYRPVTTAETGADDPLSVRVYADMASAENNYKLLVGAPRRGQPCFPYDESTDSTTAEHVVKVLGPFMVPDGFSEIRIDACTKRSVPLMGDVVWTMYVSSAPYGGNREVFLSTAFSGTFSSTFFTTDSDGWKWATPAGAKIFDENNTSLYYITLTATNGDLSTRAQLQYFGIRAELR